MKTLQAKRKAIQDNYQSQGTPKPARGKTPIDHTDKRFGRLVVIEYHGRRANPNTPKSGNALWRCLCDCGKETIVIARSLVDGSTRSCGCLQMESLSQGGWNRKAIGESAFNQLFYNYQKSARQRGYDFAISQETFKVLVESPCSYCGSDRATKAARAVGTNGDYFYTGIDRVDNTKGYIEGNVTPCCKQCNIAKGVLSETEFIAWLHRAYETVAARQARFEHGQKG